MNHKRKKARIRSSRNKAAFPNGTPAFWNIIYHSRPRRRRNKINCHRSIRGEDAEDMVWDLGNTRPHHYYW